jgi:hypothetical protein
MNIARVVTSLGIVSLFTACAATRHEEQAAPAASPANEGVTSAAGYAAEPAPPAAPAPAPQGLSEPKRAEAAQDRDEELTTLEGAERALNQAKSDLDRLALAEPAPAPPSRAAGRAEKKDSSRGASAAGAAAPTTSGPSAQCDNACRAFASLTRAANAVCRIDGDGGAHCTHAKRVVSDSERRVSSCTCPAPGQ